MSICHVTHSVCGILLWPPEQMNTEPCQSPPLPSACGTPGGPTDRAHPPCSQVRQALHPTTRMHLAPISSWLTRVIPYYPTQHPSTHADRIFALFSNPLTSGPCPHSFSIISCVCLVSQRDDELTPVRPTQPTRGHAEHPRHWDSRLLERQVAQWRPTCQL